MVGAMAFGLDQSRRTVIPFLPILVLHLGQRWPVHFFTGPEQSGHSKSATPVMDLESHGVSDVTTSKISLHESHMTVVVADIIPRSSPPETSSLYPHAGQKNRDLEPIKTSSPFSYKKRIPFHCSS